VRVRISSAGCPRSTHQLPAPRILIDGREVSLEDSATLAALRALPPDAIESVDVVKAGLRDRGEVRVVTKGRRFALPDSTSRQGQSREDERPANDTLKPTGSG
jgi:hypothetical protein